MEVVSLRRYPVKSMGGEALDEVELDPRGLVGDRSYAVVDDAGLLASGKDNERFRRRDAVFDFAAATTAYDVHVSGPAGRWRIGDPELDAELSRVMDAEVRVEREGAVPHQDAGSVSLVGTASLDWCAERWGVTPDPRRLRVNIVVATDEPFVEEGWQGREIAIGGAGNGVALGVDRRISRCRMVDLDQDGAVVEGRLLKRLGQERDTCLAVYADVVAAGTVSVGDTVTVR